MYYSWDDIWNSVTLPDIFKCDLEGKAKDVESVRFTGDIYLSSSHNPKYDYKLGEELLFGVDLKASDKMLYGFSGGTDPTKWTVGENALVKFVVNEEHKNLKVKLNYLPYRENQQVNVFVNGYLVDDFNTGEEVYREIEIPEDIVHDGVVILRLNLPNIDSPMVHGDGVDTRALGIVVRSLSIVNGSE